MCQKSLKIRLCTCKNIAKKQFLIHDNRNHSILIRWTLFRFVKEEWIGMDGMLLQPVDEFTNELKAEFFRDEMNTNQCFDFEYNPDEGDAVIFYMDTYTKSGKKVKKQYNREFLSLIYRDKQWIIDVYDTFYNTIEEIKKGFLKFD